MKPNCMVRGCTNKVSDDDIICARCREEYDAGITIQPKSKRESIWCMWKWW